MTKRDRRHSKTHGVRPFSGHRYVQDGKVRIEWFAGGKRYTRTIGDNEAAVREEADNILADALKEARAIAAGQRQAIDLSLAALLVKYRQDAPFRVNSRTRKRLRTKTLSLYLEYEKAILAGLESADSAARLTKGQVRQWITAQREQGLAEGTIARRVDYLKQVYRWAVGEVELLDANPIAGVTSPSRTSDVMAYTPEEGRQLFTTLLALPSARAWRFRAMALCEAMYGKRANQVLRLQWSDVDFDRAYEVAVPGQAVKFTGVLTFRADVLGSKGQPDQTLPLLPVFREALLEAWNRRRPQSPWIFWCHRGADRPSPYGSMHHMLGALERKAGVAHQPHRAFHGFRRALGTALVEALGVSQASRWLADTPEVILRRYLKPTERAQAQAAAYLTEQWITAPKLQPNSNTGDGVVNRESLTSPLSGTSAAGAAGLEPATFWSDQPGIADDPSGLAPQSEVQTG